MKRVLLAVGLLVLGIVAAHAISSAQQVIIFGGQSSASGGSGGAITGKILLVDGSSHLLQVDGTSKICRAGGC